MLASALDDGAFVDAAMLGSARQVLAIWEAYGELGRGLRSDEHGEVARPQRAAETPEHGAEFTLECFPRGRIEPRIGRGRLE